VAKEG